MWVATTKSIKVGTTRTRAQAIITRGIKEEKMKAKIGSVVYWSFCVLALFILFAAAISTGDYPVNNSGTLVSILLAVVLYCIGRDIRCVLHSDH
jgi:NhaP-type Na+/H+ or K+/H+ antiporter